MPLLCGRTSCTSCLQSERPPACGPSSYYSPGLKQDPCWAICTIQSLKVWRCTCSDSMWSKHFRLYIRTPYITLLNPFQYILYLQNMYLFTSKFKHVCFPKGVKKWRPEHSFQRRKNWQADVILNTKPKDKLRWLLLGELNLTKKCEKEDISVP